MSTDSNRIAKNAMSLYIRMAIATIVSLYTSRIVLNELGVGGYGTYTLVAGIVTFWLFLNGSMTTASTRFLSIAVEGNEEKEIQSTFSSVLFVHTIIALLLILLAETVGLWFYTYKLNIIPEFREAAAIVYQLSIASVVIGIIQVPYTAMCIAEERMGVFAVLEILNSFLKFGTAFMLVYLDENKLIAYSVLLLINAGIVFCGYFAYVKKSFRIRSVVTRANKKQILKIFSFTSWDLYGNGAVSLRMQGTAVLYNMFVNTIANAALGISLQIHGVITTFANNIATAVRPQITKNYVANSHRQLELLVISSTKFMVGLMLIPIVPIFIKMPYILDLWLGEVPEYTVWFSRLTLISIFYWTCSTLLHSIIHATGHVGLYSFVSGTIVITEVVIIYLMFKVYAFPFIPQILRIVVLVLLGGVMLRTIKTYIPQFNSKKFIIEIYLKGSFTLLLVSVITYVTSIYLSTGFLLLDLIIIAIESTFVSVLLMWTLNFSREERNKVFRLLKPYFKKCKVVD